MLKKKVSEGENIHVMAMSVGDCETIATVIRNGQEIESLDNDTFALMDEALLFSSDSEEVRLIDYLNNDVDGSLIVRANRKFKQFCKEYSCPYEQYPYQQKVG